MNLFSEKQIQRIRQILNQAEYYLTSFYCFSPREWFHYSYDLLTAKDLTARQITLKPHIFAEVIKKEIVSEDKQLLSRKIPVYNVVLYDRNIIKKLEKNPSLSFEKLLLYILTHELVHIARFFHLIDYHMPNEKKLEEEQKVHKLTAKILNQYKDSEIESIIKLYNL